MGKFELIMLAISGAESLIKLSASLIGTAKKNSELTAEQEIEVDARHKQVMSQAHWQIDPS